MSESAATTNRPRSRRHAIIALLVGIALLGGLASYWQMMQSGQAEREAIEALKKSGAIVTLDAARRHVSSANLSTVSPADFPSAVTSLGDLHWLESVDLSRTDFQDSDVEHLLSLSRLKSANLNQTKISDASAPSLARIRSLEALYLVETQVTGNAAAQLAKIKSLKILDLSRTEFDSGFEAVARLPHLEWLLLREAELGECDLTPLVGSPSLRQLSLEGAQLTTESLTALLERKPDISISGP